MACSSTCPTGDHESFGACLRAKNIKAQWLGGTGKSYGDEKKFFNINDQYRKAARAGLTPDNFTQSAIDNAYRQAESQG